MMRILVGQMSWKICVVSNLSSGGLAALNNALLYGSKVVWLPPVFAQTFGSLIYRAIAYGYEPKLITKGSDKYTMRLNFTEENLGELRNKNEEKGIVIDEERWMQFEKLCLNANKIFSTISKLQALSFDAELPQDYWFSSVYGIMEIIREPCSDDPIRYPLSYTRPDIRRSIVEKSIMEAHASIINHNEFDVVSPRDWAAHQAAQDLMNAMSRVLLPDISYLSFEEVKDLQERSLDELEPMRADMLRATVDLRDMLRDLHGDEWTTEDFLKEAENIIATRVEPSVRELASRIKSDVKLTALDYAGQAFKSICLGGLGIITRDKALIEESFRDAVGFITGKIKELPTPKADNAAAQYVLKIKRAMT